MCLNICIHTVWDSSSEDIFYIFTWSHAVGLIRVHQHLMQVLISTNIHRHPPQHLLISLIGFSFLKETEVISEIRRVQCRERPPADTHCTDVTETLQLPDSVALTSLFIMLISGKWLWFSFLFFNHIVILEHANYIGVPTGLL